MSRKAFVAIFNFPTNESARRFEVKVKERGFTVLSKFRVSHPGDVYVRLPRYE